VRHRRVPDGSGGGGRRGISVDPTVVEAVRRGHAGKFGSLSASKSKSSGLGFKQGGGSLLYVEHNSNGHGVTMPFATRKHSSEELMTSPCRSLVCFSYLG
jgi:hypothetical protein